MNCRTSFRSQPAEGAAVETTMVSETGAFARQHNPLQPGCRQLPEPAGNRSLLLPITSVRPSLAGSPPACCDIVRLAWFIQERLTKWSAKNSSQPSIYERIPEDGTQPAETSSAQTAALSH